VKHAVTVVILMKISLTQQIIESCLGMGMSVNCGNTAVPQYQWMWYL